MTAEPDPLADMPDLPELPDRPEAPAYETWRDRLAGWAESLDLSLSRMLLGLAALAVLGVLGWRLLAPAQEPSEMGLPMASAAEAGSTTTSTGDADTVTDDEGQPEAGEQGLDASPDGSAAGEATEVVVHVAGAVHTPGVQRLGSTARVIDAVDAAGGATQQADLARVNLAAPLQDGQQVYLPAVGEPAVQPVAGSPSDAAAPTDASGNSSSVGAASATGGLVNVNIAGLEELDTLPGVGPATAQAILDHRDQNGPFSSVDQLIDVRGIGEAKLESLRDLVTV